MADVSQPCSWARAQECNKFKNKPNRTWFNSRQESSNSTPAQVPHRSQRRNQCMSEKSKRPSYLRLDSTGEHSASSTEDLNGGFSPEIHASNRCPPRFQGKDKRPLNSSEQGGGLFDKVRSAFGRNHYFAHNPRNAARNLTQRATAANSQDERLANLDSVAEKFTNMSMASYMNHHKSDGQPGRVPWGNVPDWQPHDSGFRGAPHNGTQGHWGGATDHHQPTFRRYPGMNPPFPLLSSVQNYHRNFYPPPWQHMMGGNPQRCPPFQQGFNNFAQPWQQQHRQHPPFPWQQGIGPLMMQARDQWQGSILMDQHRQQRTPSPQWKNRRWQCQGSRKNTRHQAKDKQDYHHSKQCPAQSQQNKKVPEVTESTRPDVRAEMKCGEELLEKRTDETKIDDVQEHPINSDSAIYSAEEAIEVTENEPNVAIKNENIESQTASKPKVSKVFERHSSIDLILSSYEEVQSSTEVKESALSAGDDSEESEAESDSDSAVETNADLWESFTTDDPYNPLCGWRCNDATQEVRSDAASSYHVDSGTDEGDNWSETDSDDDYDSGEDLPNDDDVDSSLPRSFHLSDPQLKNLRESLSSTPNEKSNAPSHHPSVAFILGSTSSSSEDDSDDDWDTVDDSSVLQDDPLWNSFNRPRDPYSPMEAWKCHASNLSSSPTPGSPPRTPMRKRDSVEGIRTLLLQVSSTEQEKPDGIPRKDSEGESFAIASVRIYAAKDDMDLGSPAPSGATLKRVVSASCLRRVQLTPQDKAAKKVRFCPDSSFIVLVEKESPSSETDPSPAGGNDWQACARDRMRFKARIDQLSFVIDPVLTKAHRERVYASRLDSEGLR